MRNGLYVSDGRCSHEDLNTRGEYHEEEGVGFCMDIEPRHLGGRDIGISECDEESGRYREGDKGG